VWQPWTGQRRLEYQNSFEAEKMLIRFIAMRTAFRISDQPILCFDDKLYRCSSATKHAKLFLKTQHLL